jgi:hypothetical protein
MDSRHGHPEQPDHARDSRSRGRGLAVPGLSRHLQPVDAGQHHVEQNEIRLPGMHRLQRGLAVCGLDDREPIRLEVAAQHGADMRFVVDDEYPAHDHLIAGYVAAHDDVVAPVRCADICSRCCCISCCR